MQAPLESERRGIEAEDTLGCPPQDALSRTVHETQPAFVIEDEHSRVDLLHDLAQEGRRIERAQPLLPERLPERVHLAEREPQGVLRA